MEKGLHLLFMGFVKACSSRRMAKTILPLSYIFVYMLILACLLLMESSVSLIIHLSFLRGHPDHHIRAEHNERLLCWVAVPFPKQTISPDERLWKYTEGISKPPGPIILFHIFRKLLKWLKAWVMGIKIPVHFRGRVLRPHKKNLISVLP